MDERTIENRLLRLERAVVHLADATDRLATAISKGETWPLDRSEALDPGAPPFGWSDEWTELDELKAELEERDKRTRAR